MGGKNAVIVDAAPDLDETVLGVRHSAFGFSGQKCSAQSGDRGRDRVRHVPRAHRRVHAILVVGDPRLADVGPVIDADARDKIPSTRSADRKARSRSSCCAGRARRGGRLLRRPDDRQRHRTAPQAGPGGGLRPVLAVIRVRDFDEALEVANGTAYKLTGGVFSQASHLDRARRCRVGNLYLSRGITGALVGDSPSAASGCRGSAPRPAPRLPAAVRRTAGDHRERDATGIAPGLE